MKTIFKGRLNGLQRNRMKKLLDMMYRPREIAEEIGVAQNQIYRVYIPLGCPHERDEHNHIWIHGKTFKQWYLEMFKKAKVENDEVFCITCKQGVKIINPETKTKAGMTYITCICPDCGRNTSKIISQERV